MSSLIFRPWIPPSLLICSYHILAAFTTSNPYAIPFLDKGEKSPMVILSSVTPGSACPQTEPVAAAPHHTATAVSSLNPFIHHSVSNYLVNAPVMTPTHLPPPVPIPCDTPHPRPRPHPSRIPRPP